MSRISSRAVIINDKNEVLLMFRRKIDKQGILKEYYVVPGGGLEDSETLEENVIREVKEEMNIDIKLLGYLGLEITPQGFSNYFKAEIIKGNPHLGGEEKEKNSNENFYEPMFVKISELDNLNIFGKEYIKKAINNKYAKIDNAILTDQGICPTCYDKKFNNIVFGDNSKNILYEDDLIEAYFVGNPRAVGHTAIASKNHYKDMMEIDENLSNHIFNFARKLMNTLKKELECESVYLCTMCDGLNNHFHLQLIPRYKEEKRGSINFVKERKDYIYDESLINKIKKELEVK